MGVRSLLAHHLVLQVECFLVSSKVFLPCEKGKSLQKTSPKYHCPVKLVMGVKGTAKRHMTMSLTARLTMKKLVTFFMWLFRTTARQTSRFPHTPITKITRYRKPKISWTQRSPISFWPS